MKRLIATVLVGGLIGGFGAVPAAAKKKPKAKPKPKPVALDVSYYMRRDDCGAEDDGIKLSVVDGPDSGTRCGSLYSGVGNEVFIANGSRPVGYLWPAADGLPFALNTTKDITGEITIKSFYFGSPVPAPPYVSAGRATLVINLTGTTGGEYTSLGTFSRTYTVTPDTGSYTTQFTMTPDEAFEKAVFTDLQLETYIRGPSALHGFYELDDPASYVTVSTWAKKQ